MSRIGITYEEVSNAIAAIHKQRQNPTVDRVREILGTGSRSTIAKLMREWKAKHALCDRDDANLPSELLKIVQVLWARVQEKADEEIKSAQESLNKKEIYFIKQSQENKQSLDSLKSKHHELEELCSQQKNKLNSVENNLQLQQLENIKLTEKIRHLSGKEKEYKDEQERLHKLLQNVQLNLEHYQSTSQNLRQEQMIAIEKQRNEYEQKLISLQKELHLQEKGKIEIEASYNLTHKLYMSLQSDNTQLEELAKENSEKCAIYKSKISITDQALKETSKKLEIKSTRVATLEEKIESANKNNLALEAGLAAAKDKIECIRDDCYILKNENINLKAQLEQIMSKSHQNKAEAA